MKLDNKKLDHSISNDNKSTKSETIKVYDSKEIVPLVVQEQTKLHQIGKLHQIIYDLIRQLMTINDMNTM